MGTAADVVAIYEGWLGQTEDPPHSNCCQNCHDFGPIGGVECYAWCCASASLSLKRAGVPGFWTASVGAAISAAQRGENGLRRATKFEVPDVGWFSTFDFGGRGNWSEFHISLVTGSATYDSGGGGNFWTIGCNEGDTAKRTWRDGYFLSGFIVPEYDPHPVPQVVPLTPGDDEVSVFITRFYDWPDDIWAVEPNLNAGPGKLGFRKKFPQPELVTLAAQGIKANPQPITGGGLYQEIPW